MNPPPALPPHRLRWLVPLLVAHGGLFMALGSPQQLVPLVWVIALVPVFLALELALRADGLSRWGRWLRVLGCTWPAGVVFAALTGGWVANTAHVYGGMPKVLALLSAWLGYGSFFGLELFAYVGVPYALTRHRPWLCWLLVPLWCTAAQLVVPRFLFYTYGQLMVSALPLVQAADLLGSGGLNLLYLLLQGALALWARRLLAPGEVPLRPLAGISAAVAVLFAAALGYGGWAMARWTAPAPDAPAVELVGIQPNFSLAQLASNPALAHSTRRQSLAALLDDSSAALARAERRPGEPVLVLWPESVYPGPYFFDRAMRENVEGWVRENRVDLVLASQDARLWRFPGGRQVVENSGIALHIAPDGQPVGVYRKIALIPFGEKIPLGDWFPFYRRWLKAAIPQISEFTPGREHTVFELSNGVRLAPMICFDAANESVARGMAANGARLGVVLANLAWFGPTTVSEQFAWFARFRAIENRMPILLLSQNGRSVLIDAAGRDATTPLAQFKTQALVHRVVIPRGESFYTRHGGAVNAVYILAALALAAWTWGGPALRRAIRRMRPAS